MRISKVIINNFRVFKGGNTITFTNQNQKANISIIAGQNGFGKTTFLTALVWGFYGKLIGEVDEKYRKEIYDAGGYKKYANALLNRQVKADAKKENYFSISIEIADLYIPSVPCQKIEIYREYDVEKEDENTRILIDGYENELTKEVGPDIFINDFILPREIAKFFLFDAEKIVSLAEIRSIAEKRNLGKAYSEVLGINKYEKLKNNLENLRIKLRKKSASLADKDKLDFLQDEAERLNKLIKLNEQKINVIQEEINQKRILSEQYQEKLIREGNSISVEQLLTLKSKRDELKEKGAEIKNKLKDLLELIPFAIAGSKLDDVYEQLRKESAWKQQRASAQVVNEKLKKINDDIAQKISLLGAGSLLQNQYVQIVEETFQKNLMDDSHQIESSILDYTSEQTNEFNAIYDNIRGSFRILFKQITDEEKDNRFELTRIQRRILNAESKDDDILTKKYKAEKIKIDKRVNELNAESNKLIEENGAYKNERANKLKIISELTKSVSLDQIDARKDEIAKRLIAELTDFIRRFKVEKIESLESKVRSELFRLMHKKNFIADVEIELVEDYIEINLLDYQGNKIEKDTLSKGEQQLYATALLQALVIESGINFPIFIDSPLQKFDRQHSDNIIREFYPTISKQVILLPLLEKELTKNEFELLKPNIAQMFLIWNNDGCSTIKEMENFNMFDIEINTTTHV